MSFRELLRREFGAHGDLSQEQLARLEAHYQLLLRWNRKLNLTRIESVEEAVRLHYCESLFLARGLPEGRLRVADVGSGAGFPGFPVAVWRPECEVTLVESHVRKAVFLREASRGLGNVRVFAGRAEDLGERFDWVVSRAVRVDDVLAVELASRFGLLVGAEDAERLGGGVRVPWGKDRYVVFHVKHTD